MFCVFQRAPNTLFTWLNMLIVTYFDIFTISEGYISTGKPKYCCPYNHIIYTARISVWKQWWPHYNRAALL